MPATTTRILKKALIAGLVIAMIPGAALGARKPRSSTVSGLSLTSESYSYSAASSLDCYSEDRYHDRTWSGGLDVGGSFDVGLPFCSYDEHPGGPGGSGFLIKVSGKGSLDLTAVSPSGARYSAHFTGTSKGSSVHARCLVPERTDPESGIIMGAIESGNWNVSLNNAGTTAASNVSLRVYVAMAKVSWQQSYCPATDWNFD